MRFVIGILLTAFLVAVPALAQQSPSDQSSSNQSGSQSSPNQPPNQAPATQPPPQIVPPNQAPPRTKEDEKAEQEKSRQRSAEAGESSSRDTQIDTTAPKDDIKDHPNSKVGPSNPDEDTSDVQEVHPWNPYRAVKDDEVGEFYYKQGDYKGALARYQDALIYKPNDAVANFHLAQCYEKMKQPQEAVPHYQEYLRILPHGPLAKDARKALAKLGAPEKPASAKITSQESTSRPE